MPLKPIGGFWLATTTPKDGEEKGDEYLLGNITLRVGSAMERFNIQIFVNKEKTKDKQPDYKAYLHSQYKSKYRKPKKEK